MLALKRVGSFFSIPRRTAFLGCKLVYFHCLIWSVMSEETEVPPDAAPVPTEKEIAPGPQVY